MSPTEARRPLTRGLTLAIVALGCGAAALLLALIYGLTTTWMHDRVDASVDAEIEELVARHRSDGAAGLTSEVEQRSAADGNRYYLLAASFTQVVAGNLAVWPEGMQPTSDGWSFTVQRTVWGERQVRGASRVLPDDRHLVVGADVTDHVEFEHALAMALAVTFGLAVLLAIGVGLAMGRNLLRRVEGMNRTIGRILGGNPTERVPVGARGDEFDALAGRFNALLDENAQLIERVRGVTDDIAHDLRTPLARVRTRLEVALTAPRDAGRDAATLTTVIEEIDHLLEIFSALLGIARIEAGQAGALVPVDLSALVRDAGELYEPVADDAGMALHTEIEAGLVAPADRHLLAQALTNLLDNAIKYGASPLELSARRVGDHIELAVADRGPGIAPADRARVLQRFVRLDTSRHKLGTGLGLSFVAAVAQLHGATLDLEDHAPGLRAVLRLRPDQNGL